MEWCRKIKALSKIVKLESHASHTAFVFEMRHRYTYFMRTISNISSNLQKIEDCISACFIGTLLSKYECKDLESQLFGLPENMDVLV